MKRKAIVIAAGCAFLALPALGQGLSDRIAQVRAQGVQRDTSSKSYMLSTLLYTDVTMSFDNTAAKDAIDYLANTLGINIVGRYSDDRAAMGIDPEQPVTLNVQDKPALTVLEMILDQTGDEFSGESTWQLRDGYVEIGTKERLDAYREMRIYPVRELLFEPPMFGNAPKIDLEGTLGGGQGGGGGGGGGGGFGGGGGGFGGGGGVGGGGGGFGGGGSGGGFGGGNIFEEEGEDPDRRTEEERAEELIDLIVEAVEPDRWEINGGLAATIRYYKGNLIVRAPDYIHRQIGGYPFALRPVRQSSAYRTEGRYVTFTGVVEQADIIRTDTLEFGGAAGGGN